MKADEFIKKFGLSAAKNILHGMDDASEFTAHMPGDTWDKPTLIDADGLRRLVESHELVMEFGDDASYLKEHLLRNPTIKEFYLDSWCRTFSVVRLKQAIADVESCQ